MAKPDFGMTAELLFKGNGSPRTPGAVIGQIEKALALAFADGRREGVAEWKATIQRSYELALDNAIRAIEHAKRAQKIE
jgi:hypothetical protein